MLARNNPFRADRIESLPLIPVGWTWRELDDRLMRHELRGAIVGPHGRGKTTLLHLLGDRFEAEGRPVLRLRKDDDGRPARLAGGGWSPTPGPIPPETVVLIDSAELIGWAERRRLRRALRGVAGLIITAHRPCTRSWRLPTLVEMESDPGVFEQLVASLLGAAQVPEEMTAQVLRQHAGDVRAAFFDFYSRCSSAGSVADAVKIWELEHADDGGEAASGRV